jgi:hypothetical protein
VTDAKVGLGGTGKQIQELYAQMRKLQTDVFDQIKTLSAAQASPEALGVAERDKEAIRT